MSDRAAVVVAVAAVLGAVAARGPALWIGVLGVVVALAWRRPALLVVAVFAVASSRGVGADAGLRAAAREGSVDDWVSVLSDPEPAISGMRADVRLTDGRHAQAEAGRGDAAFARLAAGESAHVRGTLRRAPPNASWLRVRHVAVILRVDEVRAVRDGSWWSTAANGIRGLLRAGAEALPERQRSLFLGFVLGDTRGQPVDIADDFRGAGLTHLLAVSGQNVAFVLALAGPLLRRLSLWTRLPCTLALISFFALVTRFEPSVLRASAMAALAVTAATLGREASSLRLLALAVASLVVVDPFLVESVGFQLSVAACVGIVTLTAPITRMLPGPRSLAAALAVTVAAQAGVAPVLVATFDGVPVVAVPANLLAAPVAGPVMVWGLGAGMVAGVFGGSVATMLHWPTQVLIGWIATVAHRAALLPVGELGWRELLVLALAGLAFTVGRRCSVTAVRRASIVTAALAVLAPVFGLRGAPSLHTSVSQGATLWRRGAIVLDLDGRVDASRVLEGVRRAGVTTIDLLVRRTDSAALDATVDALRRRYAIRREVDPASVKSPVALEVGGLLVEVRPGGRGALLVEIVPAGLARGPPV